MPLIIEKQVGFVQFDATDKAYNDYAENLYNTNISNIAKFLDSATDAEYLTHKAEIYSFLENPILDRHGCRAKYHGEDAYNQALLLFKTERGKTRFTDLLLEEVSIAP